uniref:Uncharacterized protein n=1 Tax=mine drainage metagenome TaxID=410659 RepID=E6QIH3_9ZZZZ
MINYKKYSLKNSHSGSPFIRHFALTSIFSILNKTKIALEIQQSTPKMDFSTPLQAPVDPTRQNHYSGNATVASSGNRNRYTDPCSVFTSSVNRISGFPSRTRTVRSGWETRNLTKTSTLEPKMPQCETQTAKPESSRKPGVRL